MSKNNQTILILGGTSAVALAYARAEALNGEKIILVGRDKLKLLENLKDIHARGSENSLTHTFDLSNTHKISENWKTITQSVDKIDRVLIAYGILGNQKESQKDNSKLITELETNFLSVALWAEEAFRYFHQSGAGQLTVIGSVSGDRGRQSNYHYGAAKGGLETFIQGMIHRAAKIKGAKIHVLLVKPGFIDTPMTDKFSKTGPLWASAKKIAEIILASERANKRIVYAPWFWRYILIIIRYMPFFVFKRTSL